MLHPNSNLSIISIDTSLSSLGHFELLTHHYVPGFMCLLCLSFFSFLYSKLFLPWLSFNLISCTCYIPYFFPMTFSWPFWPFQHFCHTLHILTSYSFITSSLKFTSPCFCVQAFVSLFHHSISNTPTFLTLHFLCHSITLTLCLCPFLSYTNLLLLFVPLF